jgi:hypothetical protein
MAEHWRTARKVVGETNLPGLHISAGGTRAESNSLTGIPPCRPNLAIVVSDRPFIPDRELQPIEPLDPRIDHREFAALVIFSVLLAVTFGAPLAVAVAFMSFG